MMIHFSTALSKLLIKFVHKHSSHKYMNNYSQYVNYFPLRHAFVKSSPSPSRGYMYFGAAKDLPGVRELFEQEPPAPPRKTRGELMKDIDADYYGYRDDDDGVLIPLEKKAERKGVYNFLLFFKVHVCVFD